MLRYPLIVATYLVWTAAVFDPIGKVFLLRYVALVVAGISILLAGTYLDLLRFNIRTVAIFLITFLMPIYGFQLYALNGGYISPLIDTSYAAAGILLLTSLLYHDLALCRIGIRAMVFPLRALAIVILAIYVTALFSFPADWVSALTERDVALVSIREFGGVTLPYIYFVSSPMLIYLIGHDLNNVSTKPTAPHMAFLLCSIAALGLSGTRSHIILAIAYPLLYFIFLRSRHQVTVLLFSALLAVVLMATLDIPLLSAFFSQNETDNALKLRMLTTYAEMFGDPLTLIFGQGYNANAWSHPLREIIATTLNASKSELTYLELLRVYGLFLSLPFFVLLGVIALRLYKIPREYAWLCPAFLIYLLDSSLNPYLFSSNGMLPLALVLAILANHSDPPRDHRPIKAPAISGA